MAFIGTELNHNRKITRCQCVICGTYFDSNLSNAIYCSSECRNAAIRKKSLEKRTKQLLEEGVEGIDYVIDRWNGLPTPRMFGKWMKYMHPDKTIDDYKKEFPDASIYCQKDYEHLTANGGRHMKTEKYKKMFSEMFKGEKNPRHHSKVSEQEIRENSPYCEEFYIKRGIDPNERLKVIEKSNETRVPATTLQYFLNKGLSQEDAQKEFEKSCKEHAFTLEKCIQKHGEIEGPKIFKDRQRRWAETMDKLYKEGKYVKTPKNLLNSFTSKIEQDFVKKLCESVNVDTNDVFCALSEKGQFFIRDHDVVYSYDFCNNKHIIEFNGDYWHANPKKYHHDDYIGNGKFAGDIWNKDLNKIKTAIDKGFKIITVWESDYREDPDGVIEKCKSFLND